VKGALEKEGVKAKKGEGLEQVFTQVTMHLCIGLNGKAVGHRVSGCDLSCDEPGRLAGSSHLRFENVLGLSRFDA
jgi:hypothetical protein